MTKEQFRGRMGLRSHETIRYDLVFDNGDKAPLRLPMIEQTQVCRSIQKAISKGFITGVHLEQKHYIPPKSLTVAFREQFAKGYGFTKARIQYNRGTRHGLNDTEYGIYIEASMEGSPKSSWFQKARRELVHDLTQRIQKKIVQLECMASTHLTAICKPDKFIGGED